MVLKHSCHTRSRAYRADCFAAGTTFSLRRFNDSVLPHRFRCTLFRDGGHRRSGNLKSPGPSPQKEDTAIFDLKKCLGNAALEALAGALNPINLAMDVGGAVTGANSRLADSCRRYLTSSLIGGSLAVNAMRRPASMSLNDTDGDLSLLHDAASYMEAHGENWPDAAMAHARHLQGRDDQPELDRWLNLMDLMKQLHMQARH